MHLIQTVVEVSSLEVMRLTLDLNSGHVEGVGIGMRKGIDRGLERGRFAIVQKDHSEFVSRIVKVESSTESVHDNRIVLSTAGNENIHGGNIEPEQSQLRASSLLHRPHSPTIVHQRRHRDGNFDGCEDPSGGVDGIVCLLSPEHTTNAETDVAQVHGSIEDCQERGELVEESLPSFPDFGVITVVKFGYRITFPILGAVASVPRGEQGC